MSESAGWLCEPELATTESWMSDAYWVKANERHGHQWMCRGKDCWIQTSFSNFGFVSRKTFIEQLFYGQPAENERQMTGFSPYYSILNPQQAQNAVNIIDADGGSAHLTSAWAVVWGPLSVLIATPDGHPVSNGEAALVIADWRMVVRIANIDPSIDAGDLAELLDRAVLLLPLPPTILRNREKLRPVIYMDHRLRDRYKAETHRNIFIRGLDLRYDEPRVT